MAVMTDNAAAHVSDRTKLQELLLYRRIAWRIVPLTMVCFFFSYFDRINISFAKAQMQAELGLSDAAYGLAASMFFIGYVMFEVPSSFGLKKYGAPAWICRIMVSWGLATAALMFAYSQYTLYFLRFLIGVMEAGFAPAILFYLAYWFPPKYLARINGIWFLAVPLSGAIGAPLAGLVLEGMNGMLGLAGWHWLFLLSGIPCVLIGLVVLWRLDRDVHHAKWLSAQEKALFLETCEEDRKRRSSTHGSMWRVLLTKEVAIFSAVYFCIKSASYGINFWMPHLIEQSGVKGMTAVGLLTSLPYVLACVGMILVTRQSDRTGDRKSYLVACVFAALLGYLLACFFSDNSIALMAALVLATAGTFIAIPVFWTIPQSTFAGLAVASSVAAINSLGQLSGIVTPYMVGIINDLTGLKYMGMLSIAPILLICLVIVVRYVRNPE